MNNTLNYILILFCLTTIGCREQTKNTELKIEPEVPKEIEGLTLLSEQWTQDSTAYWTRDDDSTYQELKPSDTLSVTDYTVTKKYQLRLDTNLIVKKYINIDPTTKNKVSETDIYTRQLNPNIEARLGLTYNYKTEEYNADFLDARGTSEKRKANRMKADSMMNYAAKEGLYLCGTAYNEIVWEDVPFLPIPRKIAKDSALLIIDEWTKK